MQGCILAKVNGVSACYEAFCRLKEKRPENEKFIGLSLDKITASVVSQEAGFDSGYLKKQRPVHQAIIAQIESFKKVQEGTTLSRAEIQRRERDRWQKYKGERDRLQVLLEQSLSRELLLATKVKQLESQLYNSGKVFTFKRIK